MPKHFIATILFITTFVSCKSIVGIKDIDYNTLDNDINVFTSAYSDPNVFYGKINGNFKDKINESAFSPQVKKNLLQPMQCFYFTYDSLISYHVNCNAGGIPNLKWNRNNNFNFFPPKNQKDTLLWGSTEKELLLNNIEFSTLVNQDVFYKRDYTIIVFYSLIFDKQSKRLIQYVRDNVTLTNQSYALILVNVDNLYQ